MATATGHCFVEKCPCRHAEWENERKNRGIKFSNHVQRRLLQIYIYIEHAIQSAECKCCNKRKYASLHVIRCRLLRIYVVVHFLRRVRCDRQNRAFQRAFQFDRRTIRDARLEKVASNLRARRDILFFFFFISCLVSSETNRRRLFCKVHQRFVYPAYRAFHATVGNFSREQRVIIIGWH